MTKLVFFIVLLPLFSIAQDYTEVVDVPGKNAHQLYMSAKEWFALKFKSANDVIQMDDSLSGKIIGKGSTTIESSNTTFNVEFAIFTSVKDNKYKTSITDIFVSSTIFNPPSTSFLDVLVNGKPTYQPLFSPPPVVNIPKHPFNDYLAKKEYFKNGSNIEWLIKEQKEKYGIKMTNFLAKITCQVNARYYFMVCQTEDTMMSMLKSLESKMKLNEDNW